MTTCETPGQGAESRRRAEKSAQHIPDYVKYLVVMSARSTWQGLAKEITDKGSGWFPVHIETELRSVLTKLESIILLVDDVRKAKELAKLLAGKIVATETFVWFPPIGQIWSDVALQGISGHEPLDSSLDHDLAHREGRFSVFCSSEDEGPQPLVRSLGKPTVLSADALGPFSAAAEHLAIISGAALGIAAPSLIASANLATQRLYDVELPIAGGKRVPTSLYFLPIADSGDRKTTSDKIAMKSVVDHVIAGGVSFERALATWKNEHAVWEVERKMILAPKAKGKDRIAALQALGPLPPRPLNPELTIDDCTYEGIQKAFECGQPGVGLCTSEAATLFGGHAMAEDAKSRTTAGLSKMWDGGELKRTRADSGLTVFSGRRLCICASMQPVIALKVLNDRDLRGQGFLARCLLCQPESLAGSRTISASNSGSTTLLKPHHDRISEMLATMPATRDKSHGRELLPELLTLDNAAGRIFIEFCQELENECGPDGNLHRVKDFAQKAPENAARLAATMHHYSGRGGTQIRAEHMTSSILLTRYFLDEAKRLTGALDERGPLYEAERVRIWLRDHWKHDLISVRHLVRLGPNSTRDSQSARRIVRTLKDHGCLIPNIGGGVIDGKRVREAWTIVRDVDGKH